MSHTAAAYDPLPGVYTKLNRQQIPISAIAASVTPVFTLINGMPIGSDVNNRIGRSIFMKYFEIRGFIYQQTVPASSTFELVRLSLVYDTQPTGVTPIGTDIYNSNVVSALYAYNSAPRFRILKEWFLSIGTITTPGSKSPGTCVVNDYVPLDLAAQYNGTGTTITSIASGALFFVYNAQTGNCIVDLNIATYYYDV